MEFLRFYAGIVHEILHNLGRIFGAIGVICVVASILTPNNTKVFFIGFGLLGGALVLLVFAWPLRRFNHLPP